MQSRNGYTLVELLMTFTLLTVLVLMISGSVNFTKFMTITNRNDSQSRMHVKNAMKSIVRDLHEGISGYDSSCATPSNPDNYCILNDSTRISFKVPENTSEEDVTTYKTIDYSFDSEAKTISRKEISSGGAESLPEIVGRKIADITFTRDENNPNVVRIEIASSSANFTDKTQVFLRNSR